MILKEGECKVQSSENFFSLFSTSFECKYEGEKERKIEQLEMIVGWMHPVRKKVFLCYPLQ